MVAGRIRLLSLADIDRAVYVQSAAFQNDPLWQYLIPNSEKRAVMLPKFFFVFMKVSIICRQAYGVSNPAEGVAIWCSPQQKRFEFSGFFAASLPKLVFSGFLQTFFRALKAFIQIETMQKTFASEPHYYLNTLAVSPESRGKGVASKLVRPFLEKADKEYVGAYVETMNPKNVELYEHYGFRPVGSCTAPSTGFSIWAFYRSAKTKSQKPRYGNLET